VTLRQSIVLCIVVLAAYAAVMGWAIANAVAG
jgi:hypothetical protein